MSQPGSEDAAPDHARYVAIIMDGNARWAKRNNVSLLEGHRAGAKALKRIVQACPELDVKELTAYAFSTENWARPRQEVEGLMSLFAELIESETPELDEQGVELAFIGRKAGVSEELLQKMKWAEDVTSGNARLKLFVAFNYGGRAEIADAARKYAAAVREGSVSLDDRPDIGSYCYRPDMHNPDLVIRTSSEMRLSNFLLWQSAYSELYFSDVLWPDFDRDELKTALDEFSTRKRRFGARDDGNI